MEVNKVDGNTVFEINLGGKKYSIMDVNLNRYAGAYVEKRPLYKQHKRHGEIEWHEINANLNEKNLEFDEYLKSQEGKGFFMPSEDLIRSILGRLGEKANLDNESDEIAMLMYLICIEGEYWLKSVENSGVSLLKCGTGKGDLEHQVGSSYGLDGRVILISQQ